MKEEVISENRICAYCAWAKTDDFISLFFYAWQSQTHSVFSIMVTLILYLLSGHNNSLYFSAHTFERIMPSLSHVSVLSIRYTCLLAREYAVRLPRIVSKPLEVSTRVFIPKTIDEHFVANPRRPKLPFLLSYTVYRAIRHSPTSIFFQKVVDRQCKIVYIIDKKR